MPRSIVAGLLGLICFSWMPVATVCGWVQPPEATRPIHLDAVSLNSLPVTVDFYWGTYRLWDRFEEGLGSSWVENFRATKAWQKAEAAFSLAWRERRGQVGTLRALSENRNVQEAMAWVKDLLSEEVFVAGDGALSQTLMRLEVVQRQAHLLQSDRISNAEKGEIVYSWIDGLLADWQVPRIIVGAKVKDRQRCLTKLDEVEGFLRFVVGTRPEAKEAIKLLERVDDELGTRLRWTVSGQKIPWEFLPTNEVFDEETRDRMQELLVDQTLCITLGLEKDFFVLSVGGLDGEWKVLSDESLARHPSLSWMHQGERLPVSEIRYVSDALAGAWFALGWKDFFQKMANRFLVAQLQQYDRDDEFREWLTSVNDDAGWVDAQIAPWVPEFRGFSSMTVSNERGWENVAVHRTSNPLWDGSRPLVGLSRMGDRPLVVLDVRVAEHPEYFQMARAIVKRLHVRLQEFLQLNLEGHPDWAPRQELVRDLIARWPWVVKWADAWEERVLPSMEGEHVVSLHMGNVSIPVGKYPPFAATEPLPLPELAIGSRLRSRDDWLDGLHEIVDAMLALLPIAGRADSTDVAESYWPAPERIEGGETVIFRWEVPIAASDALQPTLILRDEWALWSYSRQQAEKFFEQRPVLWGIEPEDAERPLAKVAYLNLGGIMAAIRPWVPVVMAQWNRVEGEAAWSYRVPGPLEWTVTLEDLLEWWTVLESAGEMVSTTRVDNQGRATVRSIYRR